MAGPVVDWVLFIGSAVFVVAAGVFIGRVSGELGERLGLGQVWAGAVLLSFATTLPELVSTLTVAFRGDYGLALGGILGRVVFNLFILVFVDMANSRPLYNQLSKNHLATGLLGAALMAIVMTGLALGQSRGQGLVSSGKFLLTMTPLAILGLYGIGQYVLFRLSQQTHKAEMSSLTRNPLVSARNEVEKEGHFENKKAQTVAGTTDTLFCKEKRNELSIESSDSTGNFGLTSLARLSLSGLLVAYATTGAVIFASARELGLTVARLADHYNLGAAFAGATMLGVVTSLPEITNAMACSRRHQYDLAVGNILGANALVLVVLAFADLMVVNRMFTRVVFQDAMSALVMAGLGVLMQTVVLGALVIESRHGLWRMSTASLMLAALYATSLFVSYQFEGLMRKAP